MNQEAFDLASWSEFDGALQRIEKAREERAARAGRRIHEPLFRGLGSAEYGLETTLERAHPDERCDPTMSLLAYYRKIAASRPAIESLTGKRWRVPDYQTFEARIVNNLSHDRWLDLLFLKLPEIYEYLVYLRHHGFPSPLLDWTVSPYVAAFFAFDSPSTNAKKVAIRALLQDSMHGGASTAHLFVIGPHLRAHPRHVAQQCWYTMCVRPDETRTDYYFTPHTQGLELARGPEGCLFTITIPISERVAALRHLDRMNINAFTLFASDDSLVRTIARRELLFQGPP